jgi:hypothetical protein
MKIKTCKKVCSYASEEGDLIFITNPIFSYGDYLFVFGDFDWKRVKSFLKAIGTSYRFDTAVFKEILESENIQDLIKDQYGFCTEPKGSLGGVIYVPNRDDSINVAYHEIVHLVDYIIQFSGVSDDTEVRAVLFDYYSKIISQYKSN